VQGRKRTSGKTTGPRQLPDFVRSTLEHVLLLCSVAALLSLAYLLFIVLSGGLAAPLIAGSALDQVTRNVGLAGRIFAWALWIVVLAALIRHYRTESVGWVTILIGGTCLLGLPMIVASRIHETTAPELARLGQSLIVGFQLTGGAMLVVGLLRIAVGRIILLAGPTRMAARLAGVPVDAAALAARRAMEKPSLLRQCWELHFCRGSLRVNCPRFLQSVSCWKKQSGCYCDQSLQMDLLEGTRSNARAQIAEELHVARDRTRTAARRPRRAKSRAPCRECPVYLEHQKYKYRFLSWLSYPAAAAVIGLAAGDIQSAYRWVESELGAVLVQFQILPHRLDDAPLQQASWISAENAAVILLGVLLVGIILQLTEFAVFRLKL
jgi:hypothetical protein